MKQFSLIIPTFQRGDVFHKTFQAALQAIRDFNSEIIVVNDSPETDLGISATENIVLLKNPKKGVASARNFGAAHATSDFLIFLDDDILISAENLKTILDHSLNHPDKIFLLNWAYPHSLKSHISKTQFGRYLIRHNYTSLQGWLTNDKHWRTNECFEHNGIASYCLPIHRSTFNSVGGYDEDFPFAGFEDHDFSERLKKKGIRFFILPFSTVYHNEEDRIKSEEWLQRKERGAITRKKAIEKGYAELSIAYPSYKKFIYNLSAPFSSLLANVADCIPNWPSFDFFYFSIIDYLTGLSIYKGYTNESKNN